MSGGITITRCADGTWAVVINGGRPRIYGTIDDALVAAGNITFSPGELPGSWRVLIDERDPT